AFPASLRRGGVCRSRIVCAQSSEFGRLITLDRAEALDTALGQIERQFGKGSVMKMSDRAQVSVGAVSTGSLALDLALGIGGLPRGRLVGIFRPAASGQTPPVFHPIAEGQPPGAALALR